jgi:hypothetical protein
MATVSEVTIGNILTRTTGYLKTVSSHSLQPYRGCTYGNSLCGVGCYVQHNGHILKGRDWGGFLEVRTNAAESYLTHAPRERRWARRRGYSQDSAESTAVETTQYWAERAHSDRPPEANTDRRLVPDTHALLLPAPKIRRRSFSRAADSTFTCACALGSAHPRFQAFADATSERAGDFAAGT